MAELSSQGKKMSAQDEAALLQLQKLQQMFMQKQKKADAKPPIAEKEKPPEPSEEKPIIIEDKPKAEKKTIQIKFTMEPARYPAQHSAQQAKQQAEHIAAQQRQAEQDRLAEQQRLEQERLAEQQRKAEQARKAEEERLLAQQREEERLRREAAERAEQERLEQQRREQERLEQERREKERLEQERKEQERKEQERREQERREQERREQERREQERREQERREQERREQERREQERREQERREQERKERERREKERQEQERLAEQQRQARRAEEERIMAQQREEARLRREAAERAEQELLAQQQRQQQERMEEERREQERREQERREQERREQERQEQERLEQERKEKERQEQERLAEQLKAEQAQAAAPAEPPAKPPAEPPSEAPAPTASGEAKQEAPAETAIQTLAQAQSDVKQEAVPLQPGPVTPQQSAEQQMQQQQMQQQQMQQQAEYQQQLQQQQMQAQQQQMMMGQGQQQMVVQYDACGNMIQQMPQGQYCCQQGCMMDPMQGCYGCQGQQFDYQQQLQQQQMQAQQQQMMMGQVPQQFVQYDAYGNMIQGQMVQNQMPQQYYVQQQGCMGVDPMQAYFAAGVAQPSCGMQGMYVQEPAQLKHYGTVKVFNQEKGFGFINCSTVQNGAGDVFFLRSELPPDLQAEEKNFVGKPVVFEMTIGKDGRHRANNVQSCTMEMVHQAMQTAPKAQGTLIEGTVKSYNDQHGYGFISSPALTSRDAQFKTQELTMDLQAVGVGLVGRHVVCQVHVLPDGKLKATHLALKGGCGGCGCGGCCGQCCGGQCCGGQCCGGCCGGCCGCGCQPGFQQGACCSGCGGCCGGSMGGGACGSNRIGGCVFSFDANTRVGVIQAPGVGEVHFHESTGQNLLPGTEVNFVLQTLPDGSTQGIDVALGQPPMAMCDGGQVTGVVKVFNDTRGYGFISAPGAQQDVYFQKRDMDEASQTLLTWLGGRGIQNCTAHLRVEVLPDGRWHGRMVNLAEAGATLYEGASVAGVVRMFNEQGSGAINVPGAPGLDLLCASSDLSVELQNKLQQMGCDAMAGTTVWCRLTAINGQWHAKEVMLAGDGTQRVGVDGSKSADPAKPGLMKAEKKIIPGAELLGTMKAWNHEKGYGFVTVEGQQLDVYFQPYDLAEPLKQQFDAVGGPEGLGIVPGVVMHFWLQLMPGTGRFRGRDVSVAPAGTRPSDALSVQQAIRVAQQVFEEGPDAVVLPPAKRQKVDGESAVALPAASVPAHIL